MSGKNSNYSFFFPHQRPTPVNAFKFIIVIILLKTSNDGRLNKFYGVCSTSSGVMEIISFNLNIEYLFTDCFKF